MSVAGEHLASAAVHRWLGVRYEAAARDDAHAHALVGMAPGARHELASLAFAVALRRAGTTTLYLGAGLSGRVRGAASYGLEAHGTVLPTPLKQAVRAVRSLMRKR